MVQNKRPFASLSQIGFLKRIVVDLFGIPFNESFPAELRFQGPNGQEVRRIKDLSREGIRVKMEPGMKSLSLRGHVSSRLHSKFLTVKCPWV